MHPNKNIEEMFQRWGKKPPEHTSHGTDDEIRANLRPAKIQSWRLEGNKLIAETDIGPVVNFIPTDYILKGVDDNNMPILTKVGE